MLETEDLAQVITAIVTGDPTSLLCLVVADLIVEHFDEEDE